MPLRAPTRPGAPRPHDRSTRRVGPLAAVLAATTLPLAAACGGPPPPEPAPPAEARRYCPPPLVFDPGQTRPVRVRVENRTGRPLSVWIDRCWKHSWLATVPPGKFRQPELPERLFAYPEGLRFHTFDTASARAFGTYSVPVESRGVLTLVLDTAGRADRDALTTFSFEGQVSDLVVGSFAVVPDVGNGYAMMQADPGLAILTWSCVDDEGAVSVSLPAELEGDRAEVLVRRDEGAFESLGRWRVQHGFNDAVVPPDDAHEELRRRFGGQGVVDLLVDDAGSRQVHRFEVARLEDALAELGCWARLPAGAPSD